MNIITEARKLSRQPSPSVSEAKAAIKGLLNLLELADKAIYAVVDGDIALICDACAVKYYNVRHVKQEPKS